MNSNIVTKEETVAVVIGRWQLPHKGHETLINRALEVADKVVIVIGSAFRSRDPKNPFNWEERAAMIRSIYGEKVSSRLLMLPVRDYYDDDLWNTAVHKGVAALVGSPKAVKLVGHFKDSSSYYLHNFRNWQQDTPAPERQLDATELRNVYFGSDDIRAALEVLRPQVSPGVLSYLQAWSLLAEYQRRRDEHLAVAACRLKYPARIYNTVNALVQVGSHLLLVKRGGDIGNGLWAIPGGFVEPDEFFLTGAIRELRKETSLGILDMSIRAALKGSLLCDHPNRSPRGRLVSTSFYFRFGEDAPPEVKARCDAKEARWFHIDELAALEESMFEDHGRTISKHLKLPPRGL